MTDYRLSLFRNLSGNQWLSCLFAGWLLLAVWAPDNVYRHFFHILIIPLSIYLLGWRKQEFDWKDPFLRLFLVFCVYMSIATWLVGSNAAADDAQASRWGVEAGVAMVAFMLWMQGVIRCERAWGTIFLFIACLGALAGLLSVPVEQFLSGRLTGRGTAGHPIQGASIFVILLAVGVFLTFCQLKSEVHRANIVLTVVSFVTVSLFVVLSKSRAPIIALGVYALFFVSLIFFRSKPGPALGIFLVVFLSVLGLAHWFVGLPTLIEQLASRGGSYRLDIWWAYLTYPPESIFLGNGAGQGFEHTDASQIYLASKGLLIDHPHNIWLGAYAETGLIGLIMQLGLLALVIGAAVRCECSIGHKLHLLVIVALFVMLTFSDEYTLLRSVHPIWIFGWIPLVFVWVWSRYRVNSSDSGLCSNGGDNAER